MKSVRPGQDSEAPDGPVLYLDFVGEEIEVRPGSSLSFGRAGDLVIDESNRALHRIVGHFEWHSGHWWLVNAGSSTPLQVLDADGPSNAVLAPGRKLSIEFDDFVVRFTAGPVTYELTGSGDLSDQVVDLTKAFPSTFDDDTTTQWNPVELNEEQRLLLVALAQHILRAPSEAPTIPT